MSRRKFELDKILSENLSETEKSTIDSSWEKKVVDNCFAFEKLYGKYNTSPAIELSDKEYCNVFDIIPYETQKNKAKHAYYEYFNHVGVHWRFVIAKASEDNSVLNNANVLQKYLELINYEYSLYSNKNILLKPWYRWSLAYSAFDSENFEKLFDGYKEQLDAILKKIEPLVDKNFKIK